MFEVRDSGMLFHSGQSVGPGSIWFQHSVKESQKRQFFKSSPYFLLLFLVSAVVELLYSEELQ